jgi:aryl-alcohol dehydrogenase-like predicted oxidoreductase
VKYTRLGSTGLKVSRVALGITFWDTANVYQAGTSEEVTGRAIRRYARREDIVLAIKVFGAMHVSWVPARKPDCGIL